MAESTPALFEVKTCIKCQLVKPLDAFVQREGCCKSCRNAYARERYRADPAVREWHRQHRDRHRDKRVAYHAEHYRKNKAKHVAYATEYAKRNPVDPAKRRVYERGRYAARKQTGAICVVDDCGRVQKSTTLGLCSAHLKRYRETGVIGGAIRTRRTVAPDVSCSAPGCSEPYHGEGLCRRHYRSRYHQKNPDRARSAVRRRRARKLELPAELYTLADILARDGTACVLCGDELDRELKFPHLRSVTVEHLECLSWPDSAGDVLSNVAAAHLTCNNARRTRPHPAAARKRAELLAVTHSP